MKEIKAYIQPFMLQKVTDALHRVAIHGMSVSEIRGFGKEKDDAYPHHSRDYAIEFTPKVKIEIICSDDKVDSIVKVIKESAFTGRRGNGKIILTDVENVVSIRTGECGDSAV